MRKVAVIVNMVVDDRMPEGSIQTFVALAINQAVLHHVTTFKVEHVEAMDTSVQEMGPEE